MLDTGATTTASHIFLGRRQLHFMWRQHLEIDWIASLKNTYKANPRDCEEMAALKQAVQSSLDK